MSAINIIQRVARKLLTQNQPKGVITIPNRMTAEAKAGEIAATLQRAGLSMDRFDDFITSETVLIRLLNQIEAFEKKNLADNIRSGIRNTESAKVFDLKGKRIKDTDNIMGGEEMPPPGSRGGADDIAAPVQSSEESLKNMMMAENKKNINKIKNRKIVKDAIDNVSPGFVKGDMKYNAQLVAEDLAETKFGKEFYDLDQRQQIKLYDEAYEGLSEQTRGMPNPEDLATGGRVGLKFGSGKRFLEKVFGAEKFAEMKTRDPEMYVGLLEVVDMYRKRDKEGLKMYLQKFLPHMDDAEIEDFIRGSDGTEGLIGELIRLGSGRDYAGKIEMMKKANEMRKLDNLEVTDDMKRKPNADGGRIGYKLGTGIESAIAENKKLEENIATQKRISNFLENRMIRSSPFGILMDRKPPNITDDDNLPSTTLDKSGKDSKIQKLPFKPDQSNIVIFDDGTVYYKDTGEFYDEDLGKVTSPSPGAKPVRETKEARDGGIMRLGFKDGMNRRTFLKLFTGLVSIPIIGKIVKPFKIGKKVTQVPIIKTGDVPGKPEWFDQLVNKVILEGDDVTKRFATQERQVVHMKKIDDETSVTVTQDLNDGSIMVDVDDPIRNVMGESGQETSVQMMLKKNPGDESNPATADEFLFTENDMRNYMDGPDDYTTEFTENTVNKMKDLTSDLGKIKSYATGKKQTMKEFIESKKRKDMVKFAEENPAEYASGRGPEIDYDPEPDFAKGGIARMLGE